METRNVDTAAFLTIEKNLINIEQALNGLSTLLGGLADKSQDQAQEISWSNSILKAIIEQAEETADSMAILGPSRPIGKREVCR
jgi:hypothetical protein